jgi:hypothetical protein
MNVEQKAQAASALLREAVSNTMTLAHSRAVAAEGKTVATAACKSLSSTMVHLADGMKHSMTVKKIPVLLSQQQAAEETQSILSQVVQLNLACNHAESAGVRQREAAECSAEMLQQCVALANTTWLKLMGEKT